MSKKQQDAEQQLAQLNQLYSLGDEQAVIEFVRQSLQSKDSRIIAKASKICEEKLLYALEADLIASYRNLLKQKDSNCVGKSAVMRTLVALDCYDVDF